MSGETRKTMAAAALIGMMTAAMAAMPAGAAVVDEALWRMGEEAADTLGNNDSSGNGRHLLTNGAVSEAADTPAPAKNGSTVYAKTPNQAGYYNTDTSSFMPLNNWGVELWVRTGTSQTSDILKVNGAIAAGDLKISQSGGNWAPSYDNVAWIGGNTGANQPVSFNTWTHLAVVDQGGTSRLYINGVVQAGAVATPAGVWGTSMHLSVDAGGLTGWDGDVDEVRLFTFGAGEFNLTALNVTVPFVNGSFEQPDVGGGTNNQGPGAVFGGWVNTGSQNVDLHDGDFFGANIAGSVAGSSDAYDGNQYVAFNGGGAGPGGEISQTFSTLVGQLYRVGFHIASGPAVDTHTMTLEAIDALSALLIDSTSAVATANVWTGHELIFSATSELTTLRFINSALVGGSSSDLLLDGVTLLAVPAPAALPAGLALLAAAAVRRRRR